MSPLLGLLLFTAADPVSVVRQTKGFVALWDFDKRDPDGRFDAWKAKDERADLRLDLVNYVRDHWNEGRPAGPEDLLV